MLLWGTEGYKVRGMFQKPPPKFTVHSTTATTVLYFDIRPRKLVETIETDTPFAHCLNRDDTLGFSVHES